MKSVLGITISTILSSILVFANGSEGQSTINQVLATNDSILIMSYNVENLFDTIDNALTADDEFTPNSPKRWNSIKYHSKINHLARVISDAGKWHYPTLVGLMEVENEKVVQDLAHNPALQKADYGTITTNGKDLRGINIGLMFQKSAFRPIRIHQYDIHLNSERPTRPILYVKGILHKKADSLNLLLVHLPSKRGGGRDDARRVATRRLFSIADSIAALSPQEKILIMGDFNDSPDNIKRMREPTASSLENPISYLCIQSYPFMNDKIAGSYFFKRKWDWIDQFYLSRSLLKASTGYQYREGSGRPIVFSYMMKRNSDGRFYPFRTFVGSFYTGGYSDHLPICLTLNIKKNKSKYVRSNATEKR